ncbi:ABC transporter substrate-binding protein [Roseospira marina]|uniref:ABC transporter substrate-binding protein n=1 Tax=Roseospira marina TaxID=140057 RepID=A0A5M6IA15_9PROT|nr:ABC transporter substrate-binding protein [Roseospira marina]KAA5604992.1 ABC transporter substrate-binding protein [Roseospira marina]MBB4315003.1 peptide/nickel transport system substrate-binding protein [Roseospira marina]MBB5088003.1 peptide/nickel transport system substrate-binding protein [Roseospira marina]
MPLSFARGPARAVAAFPVLAAVLAAAISSWPLTARAAPPDSLVMGMVLEPPHLDPTAGAAGAIDEVVYANVFEGLTRIGPDGAVRPGLAERWNVSDDGLTYTFRLREGVTFHDGSAFTAEDAVFTLDRARADASVNAQKGLFEAIDTVAAPDPYTLVVHLSRPQGRFLFNLGWGDAVMVAPESADTNKTAPVGTGPFRLTRWVQGDRVELEAYPDYWGEAPALTRATFRFIADPAAALAGIMAGDVDAFANFPAPEGLIALETDPRFSVVIGTTEGETILALNHRNPPLDDVRVRRAIGHAIDRQALIDGAMFGHGTPIGSHFAPHHPAYVDLTGLSPYDPEAAKALLAEAGITPGALSLRLHLPPPSYARRSGEIIAAQLAAVGIQTEIIPVEWAQWLEQVFRGHDFDMTIVAHTEPLDIDVYARDGYYFGYKNPTFNGLIATLDETTDPVKRAELYRQAQTRLAEDAVNGFLFQLPKQGVWDARLHGLWHNSPVQANDLTGVSWSE